MDTQKLVDEACPMIGEYGWSFYFEPTTIARGERLGLDPFAFYFLGRGGVLGDVEAPVVQSAFGYFNPAVVTMMWDAARAKVSPRTAGREFFEAAHDFGRARLSSLDELGGFVPAASKVVEAARRDVEGLTLFAAASAEPVPDDLPAAALHLVAVLREFRGSAHLVAIVASGLSPRTAHFMRRPEMYETFGWSDDDRPTVTDVDATALAAADALTDRIVTPAYSVLDDDGAAALVAGLRAMGPRLKSEPTGAV
jgi:helix-turn-helix protein